jgi:phosphoribosylamine--glycine ligase/phosphoribosylformylglycinamidine cyclo-ligase
VFLGVSQVFLMAIKILILGNSGREHALAWKLSQSQLVDAIFVCPGNGGTLELSKTTNVVSVASDDYRGLTAFATQENVSTIFHAILKI